MDNVYNLQWTDTLKYGDVYHQNEVEQSTYNFEHSDADFLFTAFNAHEKQAKYLMEQQLALPAYEQVLKAAHSFNLLDARGAISVTERAAYIGRIRNLARAVAQSYYESRERLGFPMAPREWVEQMPRRLLEVNTPEPLRVFPCLALPGNAGRGRSQRGGAALARLLAHGARQFSGIVCVADAVLNDGIEPTT